MKSQTIGGLTKYSYTGKESDNESNFYDYGGRPYAAKWFEFAAANSIVPDPKNPQNVNRYAYVKNNPLTHIDPMGHSDEESRRIQQATVSTALYFGLVNWAKQCSSGDCSAKHFGFGAARGASNFAVALLGTRADLPPIVIGLAINQADSVLENMENKQPVLSQTRLFVPFLGNTTRITADWKNKRSHVKIDPIVAFSFTASLVRAAKEGHFNVENTLWSGSPVFKRQSFAGENHAGVITTNENEALLRHEVGHIWQYRIASLNDGPSSTKNGIDFRGFRGEFGNVSFESNFSSGAIAGLFAAANDRRLSEEQYGLGRGNWFIFNETYSQALQEQTRNE